MAIFKKINIGVAAVLLAGGCSCIAIPSCTSADSPEESPLEIRLSFGVPRIGTGVESRTRGVLEADAEFTAGIGGWEAMGNSSYAFSPSWQTRFRAKANPETADVVLETRQHYNSSSSVKTYMKAWYPDGELSNGTVDFSLAPEYLGDGTLDPLLAREISGSKEDRDNKTLRFEHLATQLLFKVKEGEGLAPDTRIRKIEIRDADVPRGVDLTADILVSDRKDLEVPGIDGTTVIGTTPEGNAVGVPVMLKAPAGNTLTLRVTTSTAVFDNITVTIDDDAAFLPGKAYEITLTFNQRGLKIGALVTEWNRDTGAGTVI